MTQLEFNFNASKEDLFLEAKELCLKLTSKIRKLPNGHSEETAKTLRKLSIQLDSAFEVYKALKPHWLKYDTNHI